MELTQKQKDHIEKQRDVNKNIPLFKLTGCITSDEKNLLTCISVEDDNSIKFKFEDISNNDIFIHVKNDIDETIYSKCIFNKDESGVLDALSKCIKDAKNYEEQQKKGIKQ